MAKPNLRLIGDRVLVKKVKVEEEKTAGGLYIPVGANDDELSASIGEVILMSEQVKRELKDWEQFNEGDKLVFGQHAGTTVKYKNEEYKMLRVTDIFSVVEPELED